MRVKTRLLQISVLCASSSICMAGGWSFLDGNGWSEGYKRRTGVPLDMTNHRADYGIDFFDRLALALPEQKINEVYLGSDLQSTIILKEESEVFVTFLHEGAGYRNSFGYFLFDPDNLPESPSELDKVIIFPNMSFPRMKMGDRKSIGTFPAGTYIGFFLTANGFSRWSGVKTWKPTYYTLQGYNPESTEELRRHTALLYDDATDEVIIAIEDLNRHTGDNDFNDAILSISVSGNNALEQTDYIQLSSGYLEDRDNDGVEDSVDEFPDDPDKAYVSYFPSQQDVETYAFEDLWPKTGDYDFNDFVTYNRTTLYKNGQSKITSMSMDFEVAARGAAHANAFAIRMQGVPKINVNQASINHNQMESIVTVDDDVDDATFTIIDNIYELTETGGTGKCTHFNTVVECGRQENVQVQFHVNFHTPLDGFDAMNLDPFIYRVNDRSHEIHLAGYAPTEAFDFSRFGTEDDKSSVKNDMYFQSEFNLPWALRFSTKWQHPREYIDVLWAYPDYQDWVESAGSINADWYLHNDRQTHLFPLTE